MTTNLTTVKTIVLHFLLVFALLDVPGRCRSLQLKPDDFLLGDRAGPVSYTHLDVYKRQK